MAQRDTASARRSVTSGLAAEWLAVAFLTLKGYRLVSRRYGGKGGEIDLIARRGTLVIFVEVKARAIMDDAATAITPEKIRLVNRRIRDWCARNPWAAGLTLRADAIFLSGKRWPRHIEGVFPVEML
jgi:putative endonuclease